MGSGSKNMDFMDIDQVTDVPDTPDRLNPRQKISLTDDTANGGSHSRGIVNRLRGSRRCNFNDRNTKELHSHLQRNLDTHDEAKHSSSFIVPASDWASVSDGFYNSTTRLGDTIPRRHETIVAQTQHTEPVLNQSKPPLCVPSSSHSTDYLVDRAKLGRATSDVAENSSLDVTTEGGNRGKMIDLREKIPSGGIVPTKSRDARRKIFRGHRISNLEKHMWSENASRSFTRRRDNRVLDVDVEPDCSGMPKRAFSFGRSDKDAANGMGVGSILSGGSMREAQNKLQATDASFCLHNVSNFSEASGNIYKRETDGTSGAPGVRMNHESVNSGLMGNHKGKGIDFCSTSPPKTAQSTSISLPVTSPRKIGQRRLVRNGCISPYNIAKSKGASENCCKNATNCKQDENGKVACNNPSDGNSLHPIHINSPGSEVSQFDRAKGKGIINGYIPENVYDSRSLSSRNSLIPREEDSAIGDDNGDIFRRADEIRGWQCTHTHLEKTSFSSSHHTGSNSKINDGSCNSFDQSHGSGTGGRDYVTEPRTSSGVDLLEDGDAIILQHAGPISHQVQASSRIISVSELGNRGHRGKQKLIKRPRKNTLTYNHHGQCSSSTLDDSEVSFIGSSGQPSTTKPTRTGNSQRCNTLGPVIEVDGLCSPEARSTDHQDSGSMLDDGSTARQRQVEADEILARQLQEQLYSELPVGMEGEEVDAGLAWATLHEEDAQRVTSVASWRSSLPRNPPTRLLHGRYPSPSVPSSSTQPVNHARGPTSRRMQQLRRHFYGRSPTAPSRGRSFQFPAHMDLDMRMDLLEAMEVAFGNMHGAAIADRFFQVQRDFNENDYELLLALDDDNRHAGASVDQINSLPQSTIQTGNFEEACAICLETPTIGEIIRHLPCLHKFHKECIDSWLRRKTSCPICKSSIT